MTTWRRSWKRPIEILTFKEEWPDTIRSLISSPDGNWRPHKKSSRRLKRGAWNQKRINTYQGFIFWPLILSMLLKTHEGHAHQNWAKFNKFWFFDIFGLFAKTHGHRHFCLRHPQRMKIVSLDAIIFRASTQWILDQLKMIWSPKVAKNNHFFNTLARISAKEFFWVFTHKLVFDKLSLISLDKFFFFRN